MMWLYGAALAMRAALFASPHSGQGKPPMHGDYEAQRHWMEVTVALPIQEWYRDTDRNDLQYWGLDYPPLTAYWAKLTGWIAAITVPPLVQWESSRGAQGETASGAKLFMRLSVLAGDLLLYVPAVVAFVALAQMRTQRSAPDAKPVGRNAAAWLLLLPSLVVIDHGHFQYNSISLGLALLAAVWMARRRHVAAAAAFALALNYKQMLLYFAPVFFVAMLAECWDGGVAAVWGAAAGSSPPAAESRAVEQAASVSVRKAGAVSRLAAVAKIGAVVAAVFTVLWAPFCLATPADMGGCAGGLRAVLLRLFPFERSIFEDKVSNLWCAAEPLLGWRRALMAERDAVAPALPAMGLGWLSALLPTMRTRVAVACAAATFAPILPAMVLLWRAMTRARRQGQPAPANAIFLALLNVSLAFFLAAFQVHEKSILMPALAAACVGGLGTAPLLAHTVSLMAVWSMWPLLAKDGLLMHAAALVAVHVCVTAPQLRRDAAEETAALAGAVERVMRLLRREKGSAGAAQAVKGPSGSLLLVALAAVAAAVAAMSVAAATLTPPARLPDLFSYLSAVLSCAVFTACWLWSLLRLITVT